MKTPSLTLIFSALIAMIALGILVSVLNLEAPLAGLILSGVAVLFGFLISVANPGENR